MNWEHFTTILIIFKADVNWSLVPLHVWTRQTWGWRSILDVNVLLKILKTTCLNVFMCYSRGESQEGDPASSQPLEITYLEKVLDPRLCLFGFFLRALYARLSWPRWVSRCFKELICIVSCLEFLSNLKFSSECNNRYGWFHCTSWDFREQNWNEMITR